ncbi:MAG: mechanosensitive ion channel family protein [bacterium]|nr:mechanosensitive ion channel family protein [bacterium]
MIESIQQLISGWITHFFGLEAAFQTKIFQSLTLVFVFWLIRRISLRVIVRRTTDPTARYQWSRGSGYIFVALIFITVGRIWFEGFQSLVTYFGILSAGIAIALQDVLKNLAGWLFILWRKPFRIGDRIQIGENAGDVIDQRIFQFTLLEIGNWVRADQSTGRVIHIPNGLIFTQSIANFFSGFAYIWCEIPVLLTFESDWRKAKTILRKIVDETAMELSEAAQVRVRSASQKYLIFYNRLTPIVYTSVEDSGVLLTMRFLCEPRRRRLREEQIWEAVLEEFANHQDIDFAYPTTRYYNNKSEGKHTQGLPAD